MIGPFFKQSREYDVLITQVSERLATTDPETEEYAKLMKHLGRLTKMRNSNKPQRVSRDTMLIVLGNLAGIVVIVLAEDTRVITSKAFGLLQKTKPN